MGYVYLLLQALIFSFGGILIKSTANAFSPFMVSFLRFALGVVCLLALQLIRGRKPHLTLANRVVVFGGIVFFFVDGLSVGGTAGNILALCSGGAYAGVFLMNEMPNSDAICSVFWGDVISAVTGLPFLFRESDFSATPIISLLILGVFQVAVAYILLTIGLKTTPPVTASLVSGIEPVLNPILVAVFYGEKMGALALAGAAIVIGGVVGYNILKQNEIKTIV